MRNHYGQITANPAFINHEHKCDAVGAVPETHYLETRQKPFLSEKAKDQFFSMIYN